MIPDISQTLRGFWALGARLLGASEAGYFKNAIRKHDKLVDGCRDGLLNFDCLS